MLDLQAFGKERFSVNVGEHCFKVSSIRVRTKLTKSSNHPSMNSFNFECQLVTEEHGFVRDWVNQCVASWNEGNAVTNRLEYRKEMYIDVGGIRHFLQGAYPRETSFVDLEVTAKSALPMTVQFHLDNVHPVPL